MSTTTPSRSVETADHLARLDLSDAVPHSYYASSLGLDVEKMLLGDDERPSPVPSLPSSTTPRRSPTSRKRTAESSTDSSSLHPSSSANSSSLAEPTTPPLSPLPVILSTLTTSARASDASVEACRDREKDEPVLSKRWFTAETVATATSAQLMKRAGRDEGYYAKHRDAATRAFEGEKGIEKLQNFVARFKAEPGRDLVGSSVDSKWLEELGMMASPTSAPESQRVFGQPSLANKTLKGAVVIRHRRKLDAAFTLPPTSSDDLKIQDTMFPVELTTTEKAEDLRLPLGDKVQQSVFYLIDLLVEQPGRMYAFALTICSSKAFLLLLTREELSVVEVEDCWGAGIAELSAQLYFLHNLDVTGAGFSPLLLYQRSPTRGLQPLTFSPAFAALLPSQLNQLGLATICHPLPLHTPLSRATTVFEAITINGTRYIIKWQWVSDDRYLKEVVSMRRLERSALTEEERRPLSKLVAHFAFKRMPHQAIELPEGAERRHLEIIVTKAPTRFSYRLDDPAHPPSIPQLLSVMADALRFVSSIHSKAQMLHRDLSMGNIHHLMGRFLALDWDGAAAVDNPNGGLGTRTGTLDTMSRNLLSPDNIREPHTIKDDTESIFNVFFIALWNGLRRTADKDETDFWRQTWKLGCPGVMDVGELSTARDGAWAKGGQKKAMATLKPVSTVLATLVDKLLKSEPADSDNAEALIQTWIEWFESAVVDLEQERTSAAPLHSIHRRWWKK